MALILYSHPFSSYCQKVLIALYEGGVDFAAVTIDLSDEAERGRLAALWPMTRFPVLEDDAAGIAVPESSIIVEYLQRQRDGFPAIPDDPLTAIEVRLWDRVLDNDVMTPMQRIVADRLRPEGQGDPFGVSEAHERLDAAYALLDARMAGRAWIAGDAFSLADCAAAPALFYAAWVRPIPSDRQALAAYCERLFARPSVRRAIEQARPYRDFFPACEDERPPVH